MTNPFYVDVEPDTLTMYQEMCGEARGPLACPALGVICEMQRERYPRVYRGTSMASEIEELPPEFVAMLEREASTCEKADETCAGKVSEHGTRVSDSGRRTIVRLCEHHAQ